MSISSSECGSCERIVKDGDKSGIACYKCSLWYHGACASLSEQYVTLKGQIRGCLSLCDSYFNDDVFNSEAKYNPIFDTKFMRSCNKTIQNSLKGIRFALRPTPEPVKRQHNQNSQPREVIINGFVEEKGTFS